VEDFTKRIHAVEVSRPTVDRLAPTVARLAEAEGLFAHAESVLMRCGEAARSLT
jgi:histidinol dehydrogenase